MMMIPRADNGSDTDRKTDRGRPLSIISDYLHLIGRVRAPIYLGESPLAEVWKGERFVYYALQIRMPQILNHGSFARMNECFRGCLILHPMVGQHTSQNKVV